MSEPYNIPPGRIIGFAGKMGSGKSTAAKMLLSAFPDSVILSFATPLKAACSILISEREVSTKSERARKLLQKVGHAARSVDVHIFGDILVREVNRIHAKHLGTRIFIDDVRYPDEAEKILALGGYILRVYEDKLINMRSKDIYTHESETQDLDSYVSKVVYNDFGSGFAANLAYVINNREGRAGK